MAGDTSDRNLDTFNRNPFVCRLRCKLDSVTVSVWQGEVTYRFGDARNRLRPGRSATLFKTALDFLFLTTNHSPRNRTMAGAGTQCRIGVASAAMHIQWSPMSIQVSIKRLRRR
jgi:hypothetical protein